MYRELERDLSAEDLLAAWRSQVRQVKKIAKTRMGRLHDLDRLPEAEEQMNREVEAVTLSFAEEARSHGLPIELVNGRLRTKLAANSDSADGSKSEPSGATDEKAPTPWIQRRLAHHLRNGFDVD